MVLIIVQVLGVEDATGHVDDFEATCAVHHQRTVPVEEGEGVEVFVLLHVRHVEDDDEARHVVILRRAEQVAVVARHVVGHASHVVDQVEAVEVAVLRVPAQRVSRGMVFERLEPDGHPLRAFLGEEGTIVGVTVVGIDQVVAAAQGHDFATTTVFGTLKLDHEDFGATLSIIGVEVDQGIVRLVAEGRSDARARLAHIGFKGDGLRFTMGSLRLEPYPLKKAINFCVARPRWLMAFFTS